MSDRAGACAHTCIAFEFRKARATRLLGALAVAFLGLASLPHLNQATAVPPPLREVTTTTADTGPSSELVSSIPITSFSKNEDRVVYSLEIPSLKADEVLRVVANLELSNTHTYPVEDFVRALITSSPSDTTGITVTPWTTVRHTPGMKHWTLPVGGVYHVPSNFGTRYLNVIVKARAENPQAGDSLIVQPDFGRLAVSRSAPVQNPLFQSTHELQPLVDSLPLETSSIPVDSIWKRVLTRQVPELSLGDILDISAQLQINKPSGIGARLESKITYSSSPSTGGSTASPVTSDRLAADMTIARLVHSNNLVVSDPSKPYLNLLIRAIPVSGTPSPLTIVPATPTLNVVRYHPDAGESTAPLGEGTRVEHRGDSTPDVSSIPFAGGGASAPRVVASASIFGGVWKGETIRARGLVTGDLAGAGTAQLLTTLVLADSPTATTGQTIGIFNGDMIPSSAQIHTVINEGAYVVPKADFATKYVNLVARASKLPAYTGEAMSIPAASISLTRSKPTRRLSEGFENGVDADGLDSVFEYEFDGVLSASSTVAREGGKSMLADLNLTPGGPPNVRRRVEARPPDLQSSGGEPGGDAWYGFSVYFPDGFDAPAPAPPAYYDGLIDEVRLYDKTLTPTQIQADLKGTYGANPTPIAAYSFEQGFGSVAVDSIGDNDGTIDGASWTSGGKYGSALDFDGTDVVTVPDTAQLDLIGSFTVEAWVRPDVLTNLVPAIFKRDKVNTNAGYALLPSYSEQAGVGNPTGFVGNNTNLSSVSATTGLLAQQWSHLALTSDGTSLHLYVNGQLAGTSSTVSTSPTTGNFTIGGPSLSPPKTGTWNTFTQWQFNWGNEEPTCEPPLSPPISFGVRHYRAGVHKNPGSSEIATPVEGDYIELGFNGGEVDCEGIVDPEKTYVLAPIEHKRWYDFVQHTRWTTVPGGPGNSVTEIWMDGVQVLGSQTVSVSTPSLYWYGTPESESSFTYPQFGLYRGPSNEDPPVKLYIDAVRSGNSYAEVAPSP